MATALGSLSFPQLWNVLAFGPWHPQIHSIFSLPYWYENTFTEAAQFDSYRNSIRQSSYDNFNFMHGANNPWDINPLSPACTGSRNPVVSSWFRAHCTAIRCPWLQLLVNSTREGLSAYMMAHKMCLWSYFQRGVSGGDRRVHMTALLTLCLGEHCMSPNASIRIGATSQPPLRAWSWSRQICGLSNLTMKFHREIHYCGDLFRVLLVFPSLSLVRKLLRWCDFF